MKKAKILLALSATSTILFGCSNSQADQKISDLENRVEELESDYDNLVKAINVDPNLEVGTGSSNNARKLENENTKTLSGTIVVGEDLEAGTYNITIPEGEDDISFYISQNSEDRENGKYDFKWMFSAKGSDYEHDDDVLQNFKLNEGNIIDTDDNNINFTKTE